MAYRIRYGTNKRTRINLFWRQCVISAGLGVAMLVGSVFSDTLQMKSWLLPVQMRSDEIALKDMAESISVGEGWYASAVAFCREIMELS